MLAVCDSRLRPYDVAQRVVLLVQGEQTGVGDFSIFTDADLFLSLEQQERFKCGRRVHLPGLSTANTGYRPEAVPSK